MEHIATVELLRELRYRIKDWYHDDLTELAFSDMIETDQYSVIRLEHACDKAWSAMMHTIEERYRV